MITRDQAEQIATQLVGAPASDPDNGWELNEFDAGWLILKHATINLRGAAFYVVERESGRVMRFPSYIPPDSILEEYDQVVADGFPQDLRSATLRERPCDMITRDQAGQIAAQLVGAPASDPDNGWELNEFDAGWLILKRSTRNHRGAGSYVVERASGRVLHFPSYVPPGRILEEYDEVAAKGFPKDLRPGTLLVLSKEPVGRLRRSPRRRVPSRAWSCRTPLLDSAGELRPRVGRPRSACSRRGRSYRG